MLLSTCEKGRNSKSCCVGRDADAAVGDAELERHGDGWATSAAAAWRIDTLDRCRVR